MAVQAVTVPQEPGKGLACTTSKPQPGPGSLEQPFVLNQSGCITLNAQSVQHRGAAGGEQDMNVYTP